MPLGVTIVVSTQRVLVAKIRLSSEHDSDRIKSVREREMSLSGYARVCGTAVYYMSMVTHTFWYIHVCRCVTALSVSP
jgi:hypothetical protein